MSKKILIPITIVVSILIFAAVFFIRSDTASLPVIKAGEGNAPGFAVYTGDGDILYANKIEKIRKTIGGKFVIKTDSFTVENPIGIVENPPLESIVGIYGKVLASINRNNNVLIIYIDGLGYEIYKNSMSSGTIPYIASLNPGAEALTVYPSITDVTFASMVTGETPKYTGIHSREKIPLSVPTIFDIASEKGKSSMVLEGNMKILTDEVPTILNIDENKNGTIDDEIYQCALNELANPTNILVVHFHSYDDFGHKYGPGSQEALSQLGVLDSYIENIVKDYKGDVIIASDHGMHNTEDGGEHGTFSSEDMFIPIINF
jgi:hypothetical protein